MKKIVVLFFAGLLILGFGVSVYAQEKPPVLDFKASGIFTYTANWYQNIPRLNPIGTIYGVLGPVASPYTVPGAGAWNRKNAWSDERLALRFDAVMGKELSGSLLFEIDSDRWAINPGGNAGAVSERGTFGFWNTDRAAVEVKNVFFDFALPYFGIPAPMTVRIGTQGFALRVPVLVAMDAAGITAGIKIDPVTIQPMWFKAVEGTDWNSNESDVYGLHVNAKVGDVTVGGYGLFYNFNAFPVFVNQAITDSADVPVGNLVRVVQGTQDARMWWLGAYADGKVGPANFNFDFIVDTGKVRSKQTLGIPNVKYSGWMTRVKIDFPMDMFNFGMVGHYGSGADTNRTDPNGLAGGVTASGDLNSRVSGYVVPPGSEAAPASSGDYTNASIVLSMHANAGGGIGWGQNVAPNQMARAAVGGLWFAKLYGSFKATPWYKVTVQGLYIGDTTKNGNTIGNARTAFGDLRNDKSIGWELDLINEIQIYKNLKLDLVGGFLLPGKALAFFNPTSGDNSKLHTPFVLGTRIAYNF